MKSLFSLLAGLFLALPATAQIWEKHCIDSSGIHRGEYNSLAVDGSNVSHVAYYDRDLGDLRYAVLQGYSWTRSVIDSAEDRGAHCSMAIDPQGQPHVSYVAENTWGQDTLWPMPWTSQVLKHAARTSSGWTSEIVDSMARPWSTPDRLASTSLRYDAQGKPGISYWLMRDSAQLRYAHFDGSTWQTETVKPLFGQSSFTRLAYKEGTTPVIAFEETVSLIQPTTVLKFAYKEGTGAWTIVTTPLDVAEVNALGFDMNTSGNLFFLSLGRDDSLRVATYYYGSWLVEAIDYRHDESGIITGATLTVDQQGRPGVVVMDSRQIRILRKVAGTWHANNVETLPVNWRPTDVSLAFRTDDRPSFTLAVDMPRGTTTGKGLFYYRYWPGTPRIWLPDSSHDFGAVWTNSYVDWPCLVGNAGGEAPLIVSGCQLSAPDSAFQIVNTPLPATVPGGWMSSMLITVRFSPAAPIQYSSTLTVFSNDPDHPQSQITLTGSGRSSGSTGTLSLNLYDCTYDSASGNLKTDWPLYAASVVLFRGGQQVAGPVTAYGQVEIPGLTIGEYDLLIKRAVLLPPRNTPDTLTQWRHVTVGPGLTSATFAFPEGIILQKYASVIRMKNLRLQFLTDTVYYASYPSEDDVATLLHTWSQNLPDSTAISGARLLMAEDLMHAMFYNGAHSYGEFVHDVGDLINVLFYSDSWLDGIEQLLKRLWGMQSMPVAGDYGATFDLVHPFLKYELMCLMDDAVSQAASQLPCIADPRYGAPICPKEDFVMPAWHDLKGNYSALGMLLPGFSQSSWDEMKALIYRALYRPMVEAAYVDLLTDPTLQSAFRKSERFDIGGDLASAYDKTVAFSAHRLEEDRQMVSLAGNLRQTANAFRQVETLLGALGTAGFLSSMATVARYSSYADLAIGMGLSGYAFFSLPGRIEDAVSDIYHPDGLARPATRGPRDGGGNRPAESLLAGLKQDLLASTERYDSALAAIGRRVAAGQRLEAFLQLKALSEAEVDYNNALAVATAPIKAVGWKAIESIPNFRALYDTLAIRKGEAGESRLKNYFWIMDLSVDSTAAARDAVLAHLEQSSARNHVVAEEVAALLDTVSSLPMPAVLVASALTQSDYRVGQEAPATVRFRIQNVGGMTADSVMVKLGTNPALRMIGSDTIAIGTLTAGQQSATFERTFRYAAPGFARGTWNGQILSSASVKSSFSGAFAMSVTISPPTGARLSDENIYNYPNPFNPELTTTRLRYSLAIPGQVTIRIYDAGGALVKTLIEDSPMNEGDEQGTEWNGRNGAGEIVANGLYFYVIASSAGERAIGKIAVIR